MKRERRPQVVAEPQRLTLRLSLLDAQDKGGDDRDAVLLTTVHASKGLEFRVVFCVGLEEGLFPHRRSLAEGGEEEERRLAYVAFTRAKQRLVLCYANQRTQRGTSEERWTCTAALFISAESGLQPQKTRTCKV